MQYHFYSLNKILESAKSFARFCALSFSAFMLFSNALLAETEREREAFRA